MGGKLLKRMKKTSSNASQDHEGLSNKCKHLIVSYWLHSTNLQVHQPIFKVIYRVKGFLKWGGLMGTINLSATQTIEQIVSNLILSTFLLSKTYCIHII
jgi:hypothetical protein